MKRAVSSILIAFVVLASDIIAQERVSRKHEELRGPARTVRIERAWITLQNDNLVEGPRGLPKIYTFDLTGNKTETSYFQTDGSPGVKLVYTYRPEQKMIERIDHDPDGTPTSKHIFTYDEKGNIIESIYNHSNDVSFSKVVYDYDERGNIVKKISYGASGKPSRHDEFRYKLDEKGNIAERLSYYNSQYTGKTVYTRDTQGNVIEIAHYAADGSLLQMSKSHSDRQWVTKESYTYEFDRYGNWIKQTKSLWDIKANRFVADEVVYRSIIYY